MVDDYHIKIFDTTLRDGQQCPGAGMSFEQNLEYARLAATVGVDIIEAGFPAASALDFEIVNKIAGMLVSEKHSPVIAALCQLRENQLDATMEALAPALSAHKARVHTYLPVSPELMSASLGDDYANNKHKIVEDVHRLVSKAYQAGYEVELSPESYSRMGENFDFVTDMITAAVDAGATIINCPDTIGGACHLQGEDYFVAIMKRHAAHIRKVFPDKVITWSAHCHNDYGLALVNSMNAVFNGPVRQVEGCFNGLGERAGNVALEQCIMYIKAFGSLNGQAEAFYTQCNTEQLQIISDFVGQHMLIRQPHWPITGENAAKHTSGGHTNAILSNPLAYQPFNPADVGKTISFIFGPMSGSNHAKTIIEDNGYRCEEHEKVDIARYIKSYYSERRKGITDDELMQAYFAYRAPIQVERFDYTRSDKISKLQILGQFFEHKNNYEITYEGEDSALTALKHGIDQSMPGVDIETYHSEAISKGIDAASESTIVIKINKSQLYTGVGQDHDISISALKALCDAVNQAYIAAHYRLNTF